MIVDQNYIQETLGVIFYLKLIYMKQIGEINWSPIPDKVDITQELDMIRELLKAFLLIGLWTRRRC